MKSPLQMAMDAVTAILGDADALEQFAEWFAGIDGITQGEPERIAA